jgi:L-threonylcarbamoyladenylate synthase
MYLHRAAEILLGGGVIAYPTEGVFGLGCMPDDTDAIFRILDIKDRDGDKGLILIAANVAQFAGWTLATNIPEPNPQQPVTWIVEPGDRVPELVTGTNPGLAIRITSNPVAARLCELVDSPVVSTSANREGQATARNRYVLQRQFGALVDFVVPGECGPTSGPSEIRELATGKVLRPTST